MLKEAGSESVTAGAVPATDWERVTTRCKAYLPLSDRPPHRISACIFILSVSSGDILALAATDTYRG